MSADRQRLKSAIRHIALTPEERRQLLGEGKNKGGKPGAAGVGSSTDAESQRICCDGSVSDNANPGVEERDPNADGVGQDGLNGDDPADLDMGDGTLSGVTDCATGEPICFDGGGFIPPDGWDDPSSPPLNEFYEEGKYWLFTGDGSSGEDDGDFAAAVPSQLTQYLNPNWEPYCLERSNDTTVTFKGSRYTGSGELSAECMSFDFEADLMECAPGSTADYCNPSEEEISDDSWPSDSCVNLAVKGGTIVGSKYDPENDGSYSAPRDSIDLCSGTDQISLAPAANGGWKTINSTTNNGYLYDSSGKQIAHIDGNEYSDPSV